MGLLIGGLWGLCSALCVVQSAKQTATARTHALLLGLFFLVFAGFCFAGAVLENNILLATGALLPTGGLSVITFVTVKVRAMRCKTPVWAVYDSHQTYSHRSVTTYVPVFAYTFEGVDYLRQTSETFSRKKLNKRFQEGERYVIFINEKAPQHCMSEQKVTPVYWITGLLGVLLLWMYGFVLFG